MWIITTCGIHHGIMTHSIILPIGMDMVGIVIPGLDTTHAGIGTMVGDQVGAVDTILTIGGDITTIITIPTTNHSMQVERLVHVVVGWTDTAATKPISM